MQQAVKEKKQHESNVNVVLNSCKHNEREKMSECSETGELMVSHLFCIVFSSSSSSIAQRLPDKGRGDKDRGEERRRWTHLQPH